MAIVIDDQDWPRRKLWSVDEYMRLCDLGVIGAEDRLDLLEGEIVQKVGRNFPHVDGIRALMGILREVFETGFDVSAQLPIVAVDSVPEPDGLVLIGSWRDYRGRFPTPQEVVLVAEVADESRLRHDQQTKLRIYARAGFSEYWIVNLVGLRLEVYRQPLSTGMYAEVRHYSMTESVAIGGDPQRIVKVSDLLPETE